MPEKPITDSDAHGDPAGIRFGSPVPLVSVAGTATECGEQLGAIWRDILRARRNPPNSTETPWWLENSGAAARWVDAIAPHLRDVMRGMQKGAGLGETAWDDAGSCRCLPREPGCTAFSVAASATLAGAPLSGQTKDTARESADRYVVLRMMPQNAPAFLTVTYPGELFGYGFASTGVSIFRNALYAGAPASGLPFHVWGLLSLCGAGVDTAREIALREGVRFAGNALLSDARGRALSVEGTAGGLGILESAGGCLVHANHVETESLKAFERRDARQLDASRHRRRRLEELLRGELGRLTAERCLAFLSDHANYPCSLCCHMDPPRQETTAAIVAEPTRGQLRVVRGAPCANPSAVYSLSMK